MPVRKTPRPPKSRRSPTPSPPSEADVTTSITCEGCRYDAPGQMAHMGPGGCLSLLAGSDDEDD